MLEVREVAVPPVRVILPNQDMFSHTGLATHVGTRINGCELARELQMEANGMASGLDVTGR